MPSATGQTIMSSAKQFRVKHTRDTKKYPGSISITGHEYLSAISETSGTIGKNILTFYLNPLSFVNTRLEKYGQLYEKFVFRRFVLHYTSAQPTTATGQYILAFDRDFADSTPAASDDGIRQYFAMSGSKIANVYQSTSFSCPLEDPQDFYYTNSTGYEGRVVYQGQVYMAVVTGTTFTGSMWIEYDLDLFDPMVDQVSLSRLALHNTPYSITDTGAWISFLQQESLGPFFLRSKNESVEMRDVLTGGFVPGISSGERGVILPPGRWYFDLIYQDKSGGEGISGFGANIEGFFYSNQVKQTGIVNTSDAWLGLEDHLVILNQDGQGLGDSHLSYILRFVLEVPIAIGYLWLFISGALTAHPATITFNKTMLQIANAALALSDYDSIRTQGVKLSDLKTQYYLKRSKELEDQGVEVSSFDDVLLADRKLSLKSSEGKTPVTDRKVPSGSSLIQKK